MKLSKLEVHGLGCLEDVAVDIGEITVLLGENGTGKSTVLKALSFFFDDAPLTESDLCQSSTSDEVRVTVTFSDINSHDRVALQKYAAGDQVVLTRTWKDGDSRVSGQSIKFSDFDPIKEASGNTVARLYRELRESRPELGLPEATTKDPVLEAMSAWEMEHPDQCIPDDDDASHLFGLKSVAQHRLTSRFQFVMVPGLGDASDESIDRKGTILSRLLEAVADQRRQDHEILGQIEEEAREKYTEKVAEATGALDSLASGLQVHIAKYVPEGRIELVPVPARVTVSPPTVDVRAGERHEITAIGLQGHGFQRTFIIAALEYVAELATADVDTDASPTLFLAIEEPELFQHPPRARHFFATLNRLASKDNTQVTYATHSPYFVSASIFNDIRVMRRVDTKVVVFRSEWDDLLSAVPGVDRSKVERQLIPVLEGTLGEAFFARAVVLVEGASDRLVLEWFTKNDHDKELLGQGILVVPVNGKSALPAAFKILDGLGVPTYVLFDSDSDKTDDKLENAKATNRQILSALGATEVDLPDTQVNGKWACMAPNIESVLNAENDGFNDRLAAVSAAQGWSIKAPLTFSTVLDELDATEPAVIGTAIDNIIELAT